MGKGRPINKDKYDKVINALTAEPRTIKSLAEDLAMAKRTVYRYIEIADQREDCMVVKMGLSKDAPYAILVD